MSKLTRIYLTIDVEGHWFEYPNEQFNFDIEKLKLDMNNLENILLNIEERLQIEIISTWFIRCDNSVKKITGSYNGILNKLESFIKRRLLKGDAFGFHPHLYDIYKTKNSNENYFNDELNFSLDNWKKFFGNYPKLSRIGESFMNHNIAQFISKSNIEIDSSALPGKYRNDNGFMIDWRDTSELFYKPSISNYKISSIKKDKSYDFLEVPFTMLPIKAKNDKNIINRYFNLSFHSNLIKQSLKKIIKEKNYLILVVHPHEIIKNNNFHPIISFNSNVFINNFNYLIDNILYFKFDNLENFKKNEL